MYGSMLTEPQKTSQSGGKNKLIKSRVRKAPGLFVIVEVKERRNTT